MFKIFLFTILLAPIPFGANRPWAWSLYAMLLALGGLLASIAILFRQSPVQLTIRPVKYSFFLICIPIGWALLQLSNVSPLDWSHPFWQLAAEQLSLPVPAHISLTPHETATALMKLGSYLLVFFISLQFNRHSQNALFTFNNLAYAGLLYAVYGLIIYLGQFKTLLWFDQWAPMNAVTSTFVNRNSYATYAGLTLLAGLPLLFEKIQSSFQYGLKNNYGRQFFFENVFIRGWFALLLIITIATALFLTQSRGGFLSTALAIVAFFIILLVNHKIINNFAVMLLLGVVSLVSWGVFTRSGDKLIDRLNATSPENEGRWMVYDLLAKANADNSWLGMGYGSFEKSFRLYRDETIVGFYDKAHNTYLENIFELGLLQASCLFMAIFLMALVCLRGVWIRQRNWIYPAIGFSASLLIGAHALVDFSLQIPAIAYTYALIMGAAVAQSLPTRKYCP
ncbi:O-antigen ligase [Methylobacter sp. S3L5C]|uniref:O-antigen ligase family protein n=1 Tax=Methylobacter sp. S3L5C TaxID=2839024 RepID=UPI001FAD40C9|nr:O-antigen ligase family protein [Methylobacter sp. S3L5C]UOA06989.1 O-antigen ligase family protein [Methylobacter sp. S3L5C]